MGWCVEVGRVEGGSEVGRTKHLVSATAVRDGILIDTYAYGRYCSWTFVDWVFY
jgi:hypothetical protein